MHFFNTFVFLFFAGLVSFTLAQSIDPNSVDEATKEKWCQDQQSSCPLLCLQLPGTSKTPKSNFCTPSTLTFTCVCSNGQSPNASQYSQTIPYYECTQAATDCVNNCAQGDSSCQSACRSDHPCGAQDPVRVNTSTISSMTATTTGAASDSTATGSNTFTGFGGSPTNPSKTGAAPKVQALALGFGRTYGLAMVLAGVMGGFMVML